MQRDNLREFAVAAFRAYGHRDEADVVRLRDIAVLTAVSDTFVCLDATGKSDTARLLKEVYCDLPMGRIKKNVISSAVVKAADDTGFSVDTVWRHLRNGKKIFYKFYYSKCAAVDNSMRILLQEHLHGEKK